MSVLGSIDGLAGGGKTVLAEMPVILPHNRKKGKQKSPQEAIDEFWGKFTTKAPGKGMPETAVSSFSSVCDL
jgi:hypothetical protein